MFMDTCAPFNPHEIIESVTLKNIHFIGLSAMEQPLHNMNNRFMSKSLKGVVKKIFFQVVMLMINCGHVDLQKIITDGT